MLDLVPSRLLQHGMISVQSRANRQAFVARGRLNPGAPKRSGREEFSVGNAVQSAPTRHRQILQRNPLVKLVEQMEEDFLEAMLHGKSKIHVALQ